LRLE
jgi:hypothetical protein